MNVATKVAASILTYVTLISGAALATAPAHAAPTAQPANVAPTYYAPGHGEEMVTPQDYRDAIESYGESTKGIDIIVTDLPMLNCGSAISAPNYTGGGCTFNGGTGHATIVLSPNATGHVMMHEFAHARYGVGECAAEDFANTILQQTAWSYPSCARGIEPKH